MKNLIKVFFRTIIFISLFLNSCSDESPSQSDNNNQNNNYGILQGNVFDNSNQSPIVNAIVNAGNFTATTDTIGYYNIENIPSGSINVIVSKTGYDSYSQTVTIDADKSTTLNINLVPIIQNTTLFGKIRRIDTGDPVQGAEVKIAGLTDYSDFDGNYQIANIPPGIDSIFVEKDGYIKYSGIISISGQQKEFNVDLEKGTIITSNNFSQFNDFDLYHSPYFVQSSITVKNNSFQIDAGVKIIFETGTYFYVDSSGALIAEGTEIAPVIFTSTTSLPGSWNGIYFKENASLLSSIKFCKIQYAHYALLSDISINLDKVVIEDCDMGLWASRPENFYSVKNAIFRNINNTGITSNAGTFKNISFINNLVGINILGNNDTLVTYIDHCSFIQNEFGIGIYGEYLPPVTNCEFVQNTGKGIGNGPKLLRKNYSNNNFISNGEVAFLAFLKYTNSQGNFYINNNYIADNNGFSGVDTTRDATGGQYEFTIQLPFPQPPYLGNPRNQPNTDCGSTWNGF